MHQQKQSPGAEGTAGGAAAAITATCGNSCHNSKDARDFRTTTGRLYWSDIALCLRRYKNHLDGRHRGFVGAMAERADSAGPDPTPAQQQYLFGLLHELKSKSKAWCGHDGTSRT
jgi:hypothetical protein